LVDMTTQVNVQEAKTHLSRLLEQAAAGEDVVIARAGRPLVRLVPVEAPPPRRLGFLSMDVPDDFDDPLPEDELQAWA
jgi:prevent-host-death family protein